MATLLTPVIPETVTVHLGAPDAPAQNVVVPFIDYVKNAASSEIYPTWPEEALKANIYAIITFALNRIYTEHYRSRGYDFDITNDTRYDQAFVKDREIFETIDRTVNEIFDNYLVREGGVQPLFAAFCNGTTSTCAGLSQWGSVELANRGLSALEILQNYYGSDVYIVENAPVAPLSESYPGIPLRLGMRRNDVRIVQVALNRIAQNYPAIPKIRKTDGIFGLDTELAVRKFQEIADLEVTGEVDKATWYAIKRYYEGVKALSEIIAEGITLEEATLPFSTELAFGDEGVPVHTLQFYLNVIAFFGGNLPTVPYNGVFDKQTLEAVERFQSFYGLPLNGRVDNDDWIAISRIYEETVGALPPGYQGESAKLYPGYFLTPGIRNGDVEDIQKYLSYIASFINELPHISVTGYYGEQTENAVSEFQRLFGLPVTGSAGPVTWYQIARQYNLLKEANL